MALSYQLLDESTFEAWAEFVAETWPTRPSDPAFARWRYLDAAGVQVHILWRDDEIIATVAVRRRPWNVDGSVVLGGETHDWYCRSDLVGVGYGIRILRRVMDDIHPIISVGGSRDTQELLPRLGWKRVGEVTRAVLPLKGAAVSGRLPARALLPERLVERVFDVSARHWFEPRRSGAPANGRVVPVAGPGPEVRDLYSTDLLDLAALPDPDEAHWMKGHPGMGAQLALYFMRGTQLAGWSRLRVFDAGGRLEGALVDAWTPSPDVDEWVWIARASSRALAGLGATVVHTFARHPPFVAALKACRFMFGNPQPLWFWPGPGGRVPGDRVHITLDLEDHAWLPYPYPGWPNNDPIIATPRI